VGNPTSKIEFKYKPNYVAIWIRGLKENIRWKKSKILSQKKEKASPRQIG
jgi:hypothetical protein